ncbi:MAG: DUF1104 domain-containing protein [Xanthomonadaceae bacterium]|nr:DUF1104 domain-containing protein [Xanthomonadaceae bacterium]
MKRFLTLVAAMVMAMAFSLPVSAADYHSYSTEQLAQMRGTMCSATAEERQSFRSEWQQRVKAMSVDERQQYSGKPSNAAGNGRGYGSGSGCQNHKGNRKQNGLGYGRRKK